MFPLRYDNPTRNTPYATWSLCALCVAVFLAGLVGFDPLPWALVPAEWRSIGSLATWTTHIFLHAGFLHLFGNLSYLLIFGNNVEDRMGPLRFVAFYLVCGYAAAAAHIATEPGTAVPMVGASGAISGVLGAYLALFPRAPVRAYVLGLFAVTVPAWMMLLSWFAWQVLAHGFTLVDNGASGDGGVAYGAHIGGFVAGLSLHRLFLAPRSERW
ncbi:MAG: rhomboid family intramembrane serine protease [Armatimonadota bacterium]